MHAVEIQQEGDTQKRYNPNTLQLFCENYSSVCFLLIHTFSLNTPSNNKKQFCQLTSECIAQGCGLQRGATIVVSAYQRDKWSYNMYTRSS